MCYSAQIVQVVRKFHRDLGIRLDYAEAERLFLRRLDDPTINVSRGFEHNFDEPRNETEQRIGGLIEMHRAREASRLERELFAQKTRLNTAQRSLLGKETKKAREDVRIAGSKIAALTAKLSQRRGAAEAPDDDRIFPMTYAGVIIREASGYVLTPMRYACRPAGKPSFYDKKFPGLYNARRDNLGQFWKGQFGSHHAVLMVESFFENVQLHALQHRHLAPSENGRNVVLHFVPNPPQLMMIACLWSHWTNDREADLRSFAAITDAPPGDVAAAGHDRCIVNLKPERLATWLAPEGRSRVELDALLTDRAVDAFRHTVLEAA